MPALDCHDVDSALVSLAALLSTDPGQLKAELTGFTLAEFERAIFGAQYPSDEVLWRRIVGPETVPPAPSLVYWFHATRVPPGTDFKEGIQPLNERLPYIKTFLAALTTQLEPGAAPSASTPQFHPQGVPHYALKVGNASEWGPFAFLVRDAIVKPGSFTHDYLATPEIVEDAAGMIAGKRAALLIEEFRKATKPCIVKFRCTEPRDDVALVALYNAYSTLWGQEQCTETDTCFDGKAEAIPASDIVQIEYV